MQYVVVRRGVYDQGVVAIKTGMAEAKAAAEKAASEEHDLYHDFEVRQQEKGGFEEFTVTRWSFKEREDCQAREWLKIA